MPKSEFNLRALPPVEALTTFLKAVSEAIPPHGISEITVTTNIPHYSFVITENDAKSLPASPQAKRVAAELSVSGGFISVRTIYVRAVAGPHQDGWPSITYETTDDMTAVLRIESNRDEAFKEFAHKFAKGFSEHFKFIRKGELVREDFPKAEKEKLKVYEESVRDLGSALAQLENVAIDQVKRQAEFLQQKSEAMDKTLQERLESLRQEYEAKFSELTNDKAALVQERAALELERNTDARRRLLTNMRDTIGKDFTLPKPTSRSRKVIHAICGGAILVGLSVAGTAAYKIVNTADINWKYLTFFWSGTLLTVTTLIYYLRWNNAWFHQLAQHEFAKRKLDIDVLRASWVAEMLLEWTLNQKTKPFPVRLMTSFTTDLFRPSDSPVTDYHPIGTVEKMFDGVTRLRVNAKGFDMTKTKATAKKG